MIASPTFAQRCQDASCRSCQSTGLMGVLDMGLMPPSDRLLEEGELRNAEMRWPLEVAFCPACSLLQIVETVPRELVFGKEYLYFSSFSEDLLEHSRRHAMDLISRRQLSPTSRVVEIASNDGYMLRNFVRQGISVLGIDPAPAQAQAALASGVPTLQEFFNLELARRLRRQKLSADVIIANNVFAHVDDTNGFVAALRTLMKPKGLAVMEVPYVRHLVDRCEFDTIYHEHLCYFSVTAVEALVRRHGMHLNHVEHLDIHGGSLRLSVARKPDVQPVVPQLLEDERRVGLDRFDYYQDFARRVEEVRRSLRELLGDLKAQGKRLAAYGAAAKGAMLLNYAGIDGRILDFVVDRNVHKQGKYMPGVHLPIRHPKAILEETPDYVLLLPWNFKDEILRQCAKYRKRGGKFIIPVPSPVIV